MSADRQHFKSHLHSFSRLLNHKTLNLSKTLILSKTLKSTTPIFLSLLLKSNLIPLPTFVNLFDYPPLILFNTLISTFSRSNFPSLSLQILSLIHRLAFPLDSYSLCSSLAVAASVPEKPGNSIHAFALKSAHLHNIFVSGALIEFYVKTGGLGYAHKVFDEIPVKNVVCVNSLLNGYFERKLWVDGICLVRRLQGLGLEPNELTLCCVLRICGESVTLGLGMQAHAFLVRRFLKFDVFLSSSLVDMYGKCGHVGKSRLVFEMAWIGRDIVIWTSMLNAYGRNGMFSDVIRGFEEMLVERTKPDKVVFLSVLSACGQSGNVAKGLKLLQSMQKDYALVPGPEHYGCVVDMLCKVGELEVAWQFVEKGSGSGSRFGVRAWGAILSACKSCGNVEIGKIAALKALDLEPHNVGIYTELSNLYARLGMWDEIVELREVMKERGLKKPVGLSWLQ